MFKETPLSCWVPCCSTSIKVTQVVGYRATTPVCDFENTHGSHFCDPFGCVFRGTLFGWFKGNTKENSPIP